MAAGAEAKSKVCTLIAEGRPVRALPKAKVRIGEKTVHVRYRSNAKSDGKTYSFNINPNTLSADLELWICGSADHYYLLPIALIQSVYDHPDAYQDYQHPKIRVVDVNTDNHQGVFGRNDLGADLTGYFRSTITAS